MSKDFREDSAASHSTDRVTPKPSEAKLVRNFLSLKKQFISSQTVVLSQTHPTPQFSGSFTQYFGDELQDLAHQFSSFCRAALEPGVLGATSSLADHRIIES